MKNSDRKVKHRLLNRIQLVFNTLCNHTKFAIDSLQALAELQRNDKVTISPAGKGRVTVVMDNETYESKAQALWNDSSTYAKVISDPMQRSKAKLVALLKELKEKETNP